jgi:hypothetical protein
MLKRPEIDQTQPKGYGMVKIHLQPVRYRTVPMDREGVPIFLPRSPISPDFQGPEALAEESLESVRADLGHS